MLDIVSTFYQTCDKFEKKLALVFEEQRFSFEQIRDICQGIAYALIEKGLEKAQRVAIFLPNSPENIFSHIAVQMAGGIRVPINALYTAKEAQYLIDFTECRFVITDPARLTIAQQVAEHSPCRPEVLTVQQLLARKSPKCAMPVIDLEDITMLCFTSGTTGHPKAVPLTHSNMMHNIKALADVWEWTQEDILLLTLPLMHVHGLGNGLNGWIYTGCTLVLHKKFDAVSSLEAIASHRATMFFGVPAMYQKLLEVKNLREFDISSMRLWVSGSAPLSISLQKRFEEVTGHRICNRYGMTETCMITANSARGERRLGSVGKALSGMDVRVLDTISGVELAPGQTGEIVVKGPSVMKGYWKGETEKSTYFDQNGYFHTGDVGYKDKDGYFFITGRIKDIIISGGTNISPLEIEEVTLLHPDVSEAIVIPVPDEVMNEIPKAIIVPKLGKQLTAEEMRNWYSKHLARFKMPKEILIVYEPLPRNVMGKLDRDLAKSIYGKGFFQGERDDRI